MLDGIGHFKTGPTLAVAWPSLQIHLVLIVGASCADGSHLKLLATLSLAHVAARIASVTIASVLFGSVPINKARMWRGQQRPLNMCSQAEKLLDMRWAQDRNSTNKAQRLWVVNFK